MTQLLPMIAIDKSSVDHNDANPIRVRVTPTASINNPSVTCNQCQTREQLLQREAKSYWIIGYSLDKMFIGDTTQACFDKLDNHPEYSVDLTPSGDLPTIPDIVANYHLHNSDEPDLGSYCPEKLAEALKNLAAEEKEDV